MNDKGPFPLKSFPIRGSAISKSERVSIVKEALESQIATPRVGSKFGAFRMTKTRKFTARKK